MIMEETTIAQTPPNDKVDQAENVEEDEASEGKASAASNKETQTPWIIGNANNMIDLFQKYCEHIDTIKQPLYLKSSFKELLAVGSILFFAPMDHSPEMIKVFGRTVLDDACKVALDELMTANTLKIIAKESLE
ncbi:unnamed protein product, partial [Mucor circinelloides]